MVVRMYISIRLGRGCEYLRIERSMWQCRCVVGYCMGLDLTSGWVAIKSLDRGS
jgi:hypothetical protein